MKKLLVILSILLVSLAIKAQDYNVRFELLPTGEIEASHGTDVVPFHIPIEGETLEADTLIVFHNGKFYYAVTSQTVTQPIYYVKTGGDDSYTGLSDEQAWAHHPWMSTWTGSVTLAAGDKVYMKRGCTWTIASPGAPYMTVAQSGTSGSPIITGAYGTGAAPIINISTATNQPVIYADAKAFLTFDNLHITHNSSAYGGTVLRSGIYLDNECHDIVITNNEINNIPYYALYAGADCYNMTIGDLTERAPYTYADATHYSNHIHDFGYGGIILLGCNSSTFESNFKVYYNYVHDATHDVAHVDEYGIGFGVLGASSGMPKYVYVRYNRVENIKAHEGIESHNGSNLYFQDNYIKNFGTNAINVLNRDNAGGDAILANVYVERNTIEQPASGWVTGWESAFIMCFPEDALATNIYIRDNIIHYPSRPVTNPFGGIVIMNVDGMTISGNKIYDGGTGSSGAAIYFRPSSFDIKNVGIFNNYIGTWNGQGFRSDGSDVNGIVNIYSNIIISGVTMPIWISGHALTAAARLTFYNNVLLTTSEDAVMYVQFGTAATSVLTAKNNIIGSSASVATSYWYFGAAASGTFTCDYNLYWYSSSASPFYYAGGNRTMDVWRATYSFDAHTPNVNLESLSPSFTSVTPATVPLYSHGDFVLGTGSPALNVGANTGVTLDYYGSARVGNFDIGAVEKQ